MKFSAFATFGFLKFTGKEPVTKAIYDDLSKNLGPGYAADTGSIGAEKYATAMAIGRGQASLDRAEASLYARAIPPELLAAKEHQLGIVPKLSATYDERMAAIRAKTRILSNPHQPAIEAALVEAIGSSFLCLRITHRDEIVQSPTLMSASYGSWVPAGYPRKLWQITDPVSAILTPVWLSYQSIKGAATSDLLAPGDRLCIDMHNQERFESVLVTDVQLDPDTGLPTKRFRATFSKPHDPLSFVRVGRFPIWRSNARHFLVVVTPKAALDPEKRRRVHEVMRLHVKATATWQVVGSENDGVIDTFTVGGVDGAGLDVGVMDGLTYP